MKSGVYRIIVIIIVMSLGLVGCSIFPTGQSQIPTMSSSYLTQRIQLSELMQYYEFLQKKSEQELIKEYDDVRKRFLVNQSDQNRARYTLLNALPNTSFYNAANALHLLNEWPQKTKLSTDSNSFRMLLVLLLKEQQNLQIKVRGLSQALNVERGRSKALQEQVNAIKDMEKSLFRRNTN